MDISFDTIKDFASKIFAIFRNFLVNNFLLERVNAKLAPHPLASSTSLKLIGN